MHIKTSIFLFETREWVDHDYPINAITLSLNERKHFLERKYLNVYPIAVAT